MHCNWRVMPLVNLSSSIAECDAKSITKLLAVSRILATSLAMQMPLILQYAIKPRIWLCLTHSGNTLHVSNYVDITSMWTSNRGPQLYWRGSNE